MRTVPFPRSYARFLICIGCLGMSAYWLRGHKTFRLRSQWTTIDVGKGSRILYVNRMPRSTRRAGLCIPPGDGTKTAQRGLSSNACPKSF